MTKQLDITDQKILAILQQDARTELREIAKLVGITISPIHDRIQKLQRLGYIERYVAIVNREKLGWPLLAVIRVSLTQHSQAVFIAFEEAVAKLDEVLQCQQTSGECDFILHVAFMDMSAYQHFLVNRLGSLPNVEHTGTSFVLKELKAPGPYVLGN